MKTGSVSSNNNSNNINNNKIYADKFEVIENISNNNTPSIDLLSYSNNNVYADIVDLDDTETLSLMYSQNVNAQQQFDRGRHDRTLSNSSSTRKAYDEQSFYLANSSSATSRSFGSYILTSLLNIFFHIFAIICLFFNFYWMLSKTFFLFNSFQNLHLCFFILLETLFKFMMIQKYFIMQK